jgi:hypothetical protein
MKKMSRENLIAKIIECNVELGLRDEKYELMTYEELESEYDWVMTLLWDK